MQVLMFFTRGWHCYSTSKIPLHPTRNTGNASSSPRLISSNNSDEKDPQSFLKDLIIKNINRLIIGQLNINSLVISENIDILMISETKLDETFPAAQILLQDFACLADWIAIVMVVALCFILEKIYLRDL